MSNLANNTVTMEEILALVQSLPEGGGGGFPNGTEWTQSNITSGKGRGFLYANGLWVAGGDILRYSTDGKTWTDATPTSREDEFENFNAVDYANGLWLASSGYLGLWSSTDGKTWSCILDSDEGFGGVAFVGGFWFVYEGGILRFSEDGATWSAGYDFGDNIVKAMYEYGVYLVATGSGIYYSEDATVWTKVLSKYCYTICNGSGVFVAATGSGLYHSTDAITWTQSNVTSGTFYAAEHANGFFVAASSTSGLYYSEDGRTWVHSNATNISTRGLCYANGVWVAGGSNIGLWFSSDGKFWTQSNVTSGDCRRIYNANGVWVAGGTTSSANGIYYSVGWEPS